MGPLLFIIFIHDIVTYAKDSKRDLTIMSIWYISANGTIVPIRLSVIDLGVAFNSCLTFSEQIRKVANVVFRILGLIKRNTMDFSSYAITLYKMCLYVLNLTVLKGLVPDDHERYNVNEKVKNNCLKFLYYQKSTKMDVQKKKHPYFLPKKFGCLIILKNQPIYVY